mgnify:CR=1 FL=1
MKALLRRHRTASIIWAHTGLGRVVHPVQVSAAAGGAQPEPRRDRGSDAGRSGARPRELRHLVGRGGEVRHLVAARRSRAWPAMLNSYPDRFLFGDRHGRAGERGAHTSRVFDMWDPVWRLLTPEASLKVRKGNYERLFNEGRRRVREWERLNAK